MGLLNVFREALQTGYYTLVYLWAYGLSVAWVFILAAAFQTLFQEKRLRQHVAHSKPWQRIARTIALGLFGSPRGKIIVKNISWLISGTDALWLLPLFLVAGCNLTIYYWLLLGPLLGKEFVMINVVGGVFFLLATCPALFLLDQAGVKSNGTIGHGPSLGDARSLLWRFAKALAREVATVGPWLMWGSFLGGLIAVWGLSQWWFDLSQIGGTKTWLSQFLNALIGLGLAIATFSAPVANLFVATYLWKTGIALSGFVAYLYGVFLSPLLWPVYVQSLGKKGTFYLLCILAAGVIAASMGVTAMWKLAGLSIHYKLSPNQLL